MADVIHATLQQVQNLSTGIGRVLRDHQRRLKILEERGGQTNVLEAVLVNGTQLIPNAAKAVNILVPAKVSDLTNDKKFQENVIEQVLVNGVKMPVDDKKRVTVTLPTQTSNLQNDAGYQTNEEVLAAIKANAYVHPSHTAYGSGLYKIAVDALGHVTGVVGVSKGDITALGIPGQDTVYTHPNYTARGTGLYKIAVDALGHVSGVAGITKSDITALGIPGQDTNSWRGIQNNLSSDSTSDSLSAAMGKELKNLVDGKASASHRHSASEIDGLPSGGVVASGSNYVRFSDGTQIVWGTGGCGTNHGGYQAGGRVTFAVPFVNTDYAFSANGCDSSWDTLNTLGWLGTRTGLRLTSGCDISCAGGAGGAFQYLCVGRWA